MSYNEAETRFYLIDPDLRAKGFDEHWKLAAAEKAARDAQSRADAIDAAVYDLKAVNARTHVVRDNRTSAEIIESIASHGRTVDAALARLKALLAVDPTPASGD
jgi:hypothetical protein